jgi:hypothetical protein
LVQNQYNKITTPQTGENQEEYRRPHLIFPNIDFSSKAPVAQWIERQPPELKAAGSSPAGRTIIITRRYIVF